jgi:hypothetical protein
MHGAGGGMGGLNEYQHQDVSLMFVIVFHPTSSMPNKTGH